MNNRPLKKHPMFYRRYTHLENIENMGEYKWVRNSLLFGLLEQVHGYTYREKKCRTREDVSNFFISLFFPKNELGILKEVEFHQHKEEILKIVELYD